MGDPYAFYYGSKTAERMGAVPPKGATEQELSSPVPQRVSSISYPYLSGNQVNVGGRVYVSGGVQSNQNNVLVQTQRIPNGNALSTMPVIQTVARPIGQPSDEPSGAYISSMANAQTPIQAVQAAVTNRQVEYGAPIKPQVAGENVFGIGAGQTGTKLGEQFVEELGKRGLYTSPAQSSFIKGALGVGYLADFPIQAGRDLALIVTKSGEPKTPTFVVETLGEIASAGKLASQGNLEKAREVGAGFLGSGVIGFLAKPPITPVNLRTISIKISESEIAKPTGNKFIVGSPVITPLGVGLKLKPVIETIPINEYRATFLVKIPNIIIPKFFKDTRPLQYIGTPTEFYPYFKKVEGTTTTYPELPTTYAPPKLLTGTTLVSPKEKPSGMKPFTPFEEPKGKTKLEEKPTETKSEKGTVQQQIQRQKPLEEKVIQESKTLEKTKTNELTKTIEESKLLEKEVTAVKTKTIGIPIIFFKTTPSEKVAQKQGQKLEEKVIEKDKEKPITRFFVPSITLDKTLTNTKQAQPSPQVLAPAVKQPQIQQPQQKTSEAVKEQTITRQLTQQRLLDKIPYNLETLKDKVNKKLGYLTLFKKEGKFIAGGSTPLTREAALSVGQRLVKAGAARTFKIRPVGTTAVEGGETRFAQREFYTPKTIKRVQAGEEIYTQKPKFSLKTVGEFREVTLKGIQAVKRKFL